MIVLYLILCFLWACHCVHMHKKMKYSSQTFLWRSLVFVINFLVMPLSIIVAYKNGFIFKRKNNGH